MTVHLYLSLIPEALLASMLSPEEFGTYYAVGATKKSRGQAIFIEIDPTFRSEFFHIQEGIDRCVPHPNGNPKRSVYISVYRVLEHIPTSAMLNLYLVTQYGETIALTASAIVPSQEGELHLYQEIAPVWPLVVSNQAPADYCKLMTSGTDILLVVPKLAFVELELGELATDPEHGKVQDLPYTYIHQMREALIDLRTKNVKQKMINRALAMEFPYRTIKNGIFIGGGDDMLYYPLPPRDELRSKYYRWWRSATIS